MDDSEVDEPGGRPEGLRVEQLLELVAARAQALLHSSAWAQFFLLPLPRGTPKLQTPWLQQQSCTTRRGGLGST